MSTQHTPAPWWLSTINNGLSKEGGLAIDHKGEDGTPLEVCAVWGHDDGTEIDDEARANARLIAAAPDLLALAHQYASECSNCGGKGVVTRQYGGDGYGDRCAALADADDQPCDECEDIRKVIDTAEGRT